MTFGSGMSGEEFLNAQRQQDHFDLARLEAERNALNERIEKIRLRLLGSTASPPVEYQKVAGVEHKTICV